MSWSQQAAIIAETWILFSLATLLVVTRCYSSLRYTKNWGLDDASIIFAWVSLLIGAILMTLMVKNGIGKHLVDLRNPTQDLLEVLKYTIFFDMNTVICTLITKISITIYILRIKNNKTLRIVLWTSMTFMSLATIAAVIVASISCIPLRKFWNPSVKGKCLPQSSAYRICYVQSGFCIVTDLILTVSPIIILWNVRIQMLKKIRICFLMSLGLTATVSNALRNYLQQELVELDFTYAAVPIAAVVILEQSLGIIAACIPACMPFIQFQKTRRSWYLLSSLFRTKPDCEEDALSFRNTQSEGPNLAATGTKHELAHIS